MPFGLANALNSFPNFINIFENDVLDLFVKAYVDNILVFSKTLQAHKKHVKTILACIQAAGLQLDINKYKFEVYKTKYFDQVIQSASSDSRPGRVKMCPARTSSIDYWESLQNVKDVQDFLGFANCYWHSIKNFAKLAAILTALTKKNKQFQQTLTKKATFQAIKKAFTTVQVLQHFDLDKE